MLTVQEMQCKDCGEYDSTEVVFSADRGGRLCRFAVHCNRCGGFSHYLEHGPLQQAVRDYLRDAPFVAVYGSGDQGLNVLKAAEFAKVYPQRVERVDRLLLGEAAHIENCPVFKLARKP